jgi:enoyl-CoA hydratase/carnithine racemase
MDLARRLSEGPPLALAAIKQATRQSLSGTLESALGLEAVGQSRLLASDDLREGMLAFREKREPRFQGK